MLGLAEAGKRRLAYGFWRYRVGDEDTAEAMLSAARENGIDHLDTADVYGGPGGYGASETVMGNVRKRAPSLFSGAFIATKGGVEKGTPYNSSSAYLKAACDGSLKRLGAERIDLFYIHRPDLISHPEDVAETLDGLVAAGKVAHIGASNFTVHQISAYTHYLRAPIVAHQMEFSAAQFVHLFDGTLDQAMERKMAVCAWSPMAGGRLAEGGPAELANVRESLAKLAAKYGVSLTTMAYAYLHTHPAPVTPILGTKTPDRLREAVKAAAVTITKPEWYGVLQAAMGERLP